MPASAASRSGVFVPHKLPWHKRCAVELLCALVRLLAATWRTKWVATSKAAEEANRKVSSVIFCIWHNRLAMGVVSYNADARKRWRSEGIAAVVSASRDGAFLASILEHFGMETIRGSSSRRGAQALLEATTFALEKNYNVVITPDGPRGPCYKIQEGIISLAQLTGKPIMPVAYEARPKLVMRSWDKFQIPLPFAKCTYFYAEPIYVPREADEAERQKIRAHLERVMLEINTP
jgi:lysophospholipid acyltransferase (LPLAT)-like uncharacterized protein